LYSCEIDVDGAMHLAKGLSKGNLEALDLDSNSLGDRGCASILSSIPPTLTKLSINGNAITESSLRTVLNFLAISRTLRKLIISLNPTLEDESFLKNNWEQISDYIELTIYNFQIN
jgi:hypothetical protein